jgi:hypothetical protein
MLNCHSAHMLGMLRGVRGLPLVAIVEFIVRGCTDYFRDRFTKNQAFMQDPDRYFGKMMTKYMTKKAGSARLHHVRNVVHRSSSLRYLLKTERDVA